MLVIDNTVGTSSHLFDGQKLRHVTVAGEPWFVAVDVCACLALDTRAGVTSHTRRLGDDEKQTLKRGGLLPNKQEDVTALFGINGNQLVIISESGLYKLIMRANPSRPEVFNFQNWVTREVIPSIRKTGGYLLNESKRETAHADTRQQMPFPADVLAVFQQQTLIPLQ